jgi:hypothetical protein
MSKRGSSSSSAASSYIWDEWTEDDDNDSESISYQAFMNGKTKPSAPPVTEKSSFLTEKKHLRDATGNSSSSVRSNRSHPPIAPHKSPSRGVLPPQLDDYRDFFNSQDTKADSSEFEKRVTKITAADLEKVRFIITPESFLIFVFFIL